MRTASDGEISFIKTSSASVPVGYYITSKATDPNNNNSDSVVTTLNPLADLEVTKAENSHPVTPGNNLSYTITVRNGGPSTSTSVVLTDNLPSGVNYIDTANGCAEAGGVVSCALGDLTATEMATRVFQVTV